MSLNELADQDLVALIQKAIHPYETGNVGMLDALEVLGSQKASFQKWRLEMLQFAHDNGFLLVRNPNWRWNSGNHWKPYIPITTEQYAIRRGLLRKKETETIIKKAVVLETIDEYGYANVPERILVRAAEALTKSKGLLSTVRIASVSENEFTLQKQDPILLGYSMKNPGENFQWWTSNKEPNHVFVGVESEFAIVLGMWGKDLQEINLALFPQNPIIS